VVGPFADTHELIQFARGFLTERTDSLRHDAQVCTAGATAAFPAILYAFATVDLLGALLGGDAKGPKGMTERTKSYMRRFMHYSEDQCILLLDVFRHKIVHLAQPNPVTLFKNTLTSWGYSHDDLQHHLKLVPLAPPLQVTVTSALQINADQRFEMSIRHFVEDIVDSVHAPGAYLHSLASDADLQARFAKAVTDIYSP
jgi:hypothetical protein